MIVSALWPKLLGDSIRLTSNFELLEELDSLKALRSASAEVPLLRPRSKMGDMVDLDLDEGLAQFRDVAISSILWDVF